MTVWGWVWFSWILAAVVLEAVAIIRDEPGDTLSEQAWRLQDWLLKHGKVGAFARVVLVVAFTGFVGWLVLHFTTRLV